MNMRISNTVILASKVDNLKSTTRQVVLRLLL